MTQRFTEQTGAGSREGRLPALPHWDEIEIPDAPVAARSDESASGLRSAATSLDNASPVLYDGGANGNSGLGRVLSALSLGGLPRMALDVAYLRSGIITGRRVEGGLMRADIAVFCEKADGPRSSWPPRAPSKGVDAP